MAIDPDKLAEAFAQLPDAPSSLCPLGRLLADLPDKPRSSLQAALDADRNAVSNNWILDKLRSGGVRANKDTVSNHRNNRCRCRR